MSEAEQKGLLNEPMASTLSEVRLLEVWHVLGGPEPRRGRAPAWWRESHDPNVTVDIDRGVFYDHVQNCGGGVLALVETVLDCNRARALAWLESEGFIEPRALTSGQKRKHARQRDEATSSAIEIAYWRGAFVFELNAHKVAAIEAADDAALTRAASLCNVLENGSPQDVIREFICQRTTDPETLARLVAVGRERDDEERRITAEVVLLLAHATELEAFSNAK